MILFPIYLYPILYLPLLTAQSPTQFLDSLLQHYAFSSILRQRTGVISGTNVPSNLAGIEVGAVRLRSGSLRRRGIKSYKEFQIPIGIIEDPYVERLVLVYQNLANWSSFYYPLPGYVYLSSVLGLFAYNASVTSTAFGLNLRSIENPILIRFQNVKSAPDGLFPKCLCFGLYGSLEFGNVLSGNVCSTTKQGHFAIVVELAAPAPALAGKIPVGGGGGGEGKYWVWVVGGSVVGGFVVAGLFGVLVVWMRICRQRRESEKLEAAAAAEGGAPLLMAAIGGRMKVPVATGTRTRPVLENEYLL